MRVNYSNPRYRPTNMKEEDTRIKEARRLLWEVTNEQRHREKQVVLKEKCICKHTRKNHSVAHSINYTGGVCKNCKCMNFLLK